MEKKLNIKMKANNKSVNNTPIACNTENNALIAYNIEKNALIAYNIENNANT